MTNFYIAVTVEETTEHGPGYYAYVVRCAESFNLKYLLENIGGLVHANIFPTKKRAAEIVQFWNDSYKANGTYLFSSPAF